MLWRRANARNVRLYYLRYYLYWQYTDLFIFRFVWFRKGHLGSLWTSSGYLFHGASSSTCLFSFSSLLNDIPLSSESKIVFGWMASPKQSVSNDWSKQAVKMHDAWDIEIGCLYIDIFHVTSEARRRPYLKPSRARNYIQLIGQNYHFEIYSSVVEKIKLFWVEFSRWNLQYLFQSMPVS